MQQRFSFAPLVYVTLLMVPVYWLMSTYTRRLAAMDYMDVQISLDGATAAINDPVRGLAAQQADAAARTIASRAGSPDETEPFRPILRGLLLTGEGDLAVNLEFHAMADFRPESIVRQVQPLAKLLDDGLAYVKDSAGELLQSPGVRTGVPARLHLEVIDGQVRREQNWIGGSDYAPRDALHVPPP